VKPNGVFEISRITIIKVKEPRYFHFQYDGRWFEMLTKLKEEADLWVACLGFLSAHKRRELACLVSGGEQPGASYFHTLVNT
jgi:hypothetical protein